jgi:hypothetical protein
MREIHANLAHSCLAMALSEEDVGDGGCCSNSMCGVIRIGERDFAPSVLGAGVLSWHKGDADRRVLLVRRVPL